MDLTSTVQPARRWLSGWEELTILPPGDLKLQLTGPEAREILKVGPTTGKRWQVRLRVEVAETDLA